MASPECAQPIEQKVEKAPPKPSLTERLDNLKKKIFEKKEEPLTKERIQSTIDSAAYNYEYHPATTHFEGLKVAYEQIQQAKAAGIDTSSLEQSINKKIGENIKGRVETFTERAITLIKNPDPNEKILVYNQTAWHAENFVIQAILGAKAAGMDTSALENFVIQRVGKEVSNYLLSARKNVMNGDIFRAESLLRDFKDIPGFSVQMQKYATEVKTTGKLARLIEDAKSEILRPTLAGEYIAELSNMKNMGIDITAYKSQIPNDFATKTEKELSATIKTYETWKQYKKLDVHGDEMNKTRNLLQAAKNIGINFRDLETRFAQLEKTA